MQKPTELDDIQKIRSLIQKIEDESITAEEYSEFLVLVNDEENRSYFDQVLEQDLKVYYGQDTENFPQRNPSQRWVIRWSAAAVLILLVSAVVLLNLNKKPGSVYSTSNGETLKITLPDNSLVTLNANSELTWMESKNNVREVRLTGEAYFDVRHMDDKPFFVYSNTLSIKVLGTTFNVNNRNGNEEIYLKEGVIQISNQTNSQEDVILNTGESAYFDSAKSEVVKTNNKKYADQSLWKEGILKFTDTSVKDILIHIEDIYGVNLKLEDAELMNRPMDFALPYTDWELVSEALALALGKKLVRNDDYYELVN